MQSPHSTELPSDIVERLRARDSVAYEMLLRVVGPSLLAYGASIAGSVEVAEELLQEIVFRIWKHGATFAPTSSLVAYLYGAMRNEALGVLRRDAARDRALERLSRDDNADRQAETDAVEHDAETEMQLEALRSALAGLTEHQRTAFALRYGQGMSVAEVAAVLEISLKGAERLITRIRTFLREQLLR